MLHREYPNSGYTDFGVICKIKMLKEGISLSDVATHCGVSSAYINDIFKGYRKGTAIQEKVACFLKINEEEGVREPKSGTIS